MEKMAIIKQLEAALPKEYRYATFYYKNTYVPLYTFLEQEFINFLKDGADVQTLSNYVRNKLGSFIKENNPTLKRVDDFITNNPMFIDAIQISQGEVISARDYLNEYCLKNMQEDGMINFAGKTLTIEELYLKLLNNSYHEPTIEEKAELCVDMLNYIDKEILDSIVDGMNITVREYISTIIPTKMNSATTVEMNGEVIELSDLVKQIIDHQAKMLIEHEEKQKEELENKYNKTGDNPGLVSEIQVKLAEDNSLTVTAEIPVVTSSLLTNEEKKSLLNNYSRRENITDEEYFHSELNKIKSSIDYTTTLQDLDAKEKFFLRVQEEARAKVSSSRLEALISSIEELITKRRNNIIKVNGNQEEYTDILFSEINAMKDELSKAASLDDFSVLYGKALDRYEEILNKGIKDIQLKGDFQLLLENISEKRLNLDATIGYQSPEVERIKVDLNTLITAIKQDILTIEHDPNNLGNLTGTEIRLNLNIEKAKDQVEKAYTEGMLTEDDREYYMNRLKGYSMALQSETKIGYGLN